MYHKERYGYRRITLELRNQGYKVNHKKVYRIMVKLGLKSLKRNKRKYSSYKGTVGKVVDNLINRDFEADKPNEKWYTDVTEFNLRGEKIYLSPIIDGFNQEVISHNIFYTAITRAMNKLKIYWTPECEERIIKSLKQKFNAKDACIVRNKMKQI